MNKKLARVMALAMAGTLMLSGCGGSEGDTEEPKDANGTEDKQEAKNDKELKELVIPMAVTRELETFNALYSQRGEDAENLTNLIDGLLEVDSYGKLQPCLAEEWGTEDGGLTWKFKLRDGVKWVDVNAQEKAACNAQDFATGLEWVLNFHKNDSSNTSMPLEMIQGAKEYYEYTKTLSKEEAYALTAGEGSKFREMVGLETPDDLTVIYHCTAPKPYFDSVATYFCLYPMAQGMVDELGGPDGVRQMNNENMWYNGCYTMTEYIQGNEKIYTKNPTYWDTECKLFDSVTFRMVESSDIAYQLYQNGEVDSCGLSESNVNIIKGNENNEFHDYLCETLPKKYSYQYLFNYNKMNEDGTPDKNWNTAVANEAFRQSFRYGIDFTKDYARLNPINPMKCENNFFSMKGLCYTSDGTDYTQLVADELGLTINGETPARLDKEKAAQYKKQAMEELTALGVTFPVSCDFYIPASNQVSLDSANVLKDIFSECLGDDYVVLNIKTYVSKPTSEVIEPQLHSITGNGWGADYGDPVNYLGQMTYGSEQAYYSESYTNINQLTEETPENKALLDTYKEYTEMVTAADAIVDDMDARYKAFAKAEAYMIDHALTIPHEYGINWTLTKINSYSKMNAMYGSVNEKMKNWETNADGYTTEEMEAIAAEHEAGAKA